MVGQIDFEAVAAARPDVILAVYAGLTEQEFETLSAIAPVVAQPDEHVDFGVPWDEQTVEIGRVLGQEAEAEALVEEVEGAFADAWADHPAFEVRSGWWPPRRKGWSSCTRPRTPGAGS